MSHKKKRAERKKTLWEGTLQRSVSKTSESENKTNLIISNWNRWNKSQIFCSRVHRGLQDSIIKVILTVDLIKYQYQSHGKGRIETRLHAEPKDFLPEHNAGGGVHFATNLSHKFLSGIENLAAALREATFDEVLHTGAIVHLHRHAGPRPSDDRRSLDAENGFMTLRSLPFEAFPALMKTRFLAIEKE